MECKNQKTRLHAGDCVSFTGQIALFCDLHHRSTTREQNADHSAIVILGCYVKAEPARTALLPFALPSTEAMAVSLSESALSLLVAKKARCAQATVDLQATAA